MKVLAEAKGGRKLVAFEDGTRVVDAGGVRAATTVSEDLKALVLEDPDLLNFIDLNYYGPETVAAQSLLNELNVAEHKRRRKTK